MMSIKNLSKMEVKDLYTIFDPNSHDFIGKNPGGNIILCKDTPSAI
jgi:hypothetical protein